LLARRASKLAKPPVKALAILEVQHGIRRVVRVENPLHAYDVRMLESGKRLRFLPEALQTPLKITFFSVAGRDRDGVLLPVSMGPGKVLLDCHARFKGQIDCEIGDPETALAQQSVDPVVVEEAHPVR